MVMLSSVHSAYHFGTKRTETISNTLYTSLKSSLVGATSANAIVDKQFWEFSK